MSWMFKYFHSLRMSALGFVLRLARCLGHFLIRISANGNKLNLDSGQFSGFLSGIPKNNTKDPMSSSIEVGSYSYTYGQVASDNQDIEFIPTAIESLAAEGLEASYLRNVLRLKGICVNDIMVPRSEVDAVCDSMFLADLLLDFAKSERSRLPVYNETLDDAQHMVHIRDLMSYIVKVATDPDRQCIDFSKINNEIKLADLGVMREVLSVPGSMPVTDLLMHMQKQHIQLALVIDEFGGVDGLVSIEDIVELVVGDIRDEHDVGRDVITISRVGAAAWLAEGATELDIIAKVTNVDFRQISQNNNGIETLNGAIFAMAGSVPPSGQTLSFEELPGISFKILESDSRCINRVLITRSSL